MRRHHALLPIALALALVLVPAASASTLIPAKRCFTRVPTKGSEPLRFTITGGVPFGRYLVSNVDGKLGSVEGTFDAAGNSINAITDFSTNGSIDPIKALTIPLQVQEYGGPYVGNVTGGGNVTVTNAEMKISNSPYNPTRKRIWVMSGLTPLFGRGTLYATWTNRGHKKALRTVKLGKPKNSCGYLRIKRRSIPFIRNGSWTIYVHVGKHFVRSHSTAWYYRAFGLR